VEDATVHCEQQAEAVEKEEIASIQQAMKQRRSEAPNEESASPSKKKAGRKKKKFGRAPKDAMNAAEKRRGSRSRRNRIPLSRTKLNRPRRVRR
jgi:hypothetical protein